MSKKGRKFKAVQTKAAPIIPVPPAEGLSDKLARIEKLRKDLAVEEGVLIEKALQSNDPDDLIKASSVAAKFFNDIRENKSQKSFLFDPFFQDTSQGYREKPVAMSDQMLRRMGKAPIIKAIIGKRVEQVVAFAEPQPNKYSTGFVIKPKKRIGQEDDKKLTDEDMQKIAYLTDFITNCGDTENAWHGDDFDSFLRKIVGDSLTLDKMTFEIIADRKGRPVEFLATDAATMKLALNSQSNDLHRQMKNGYYPTTCQVWDNQILTDFYPWELCFAIRNPITDIRYNGYGVSELEDLIQTVTAMLWSNEYNTRFFSQGSMPKGIMRVSSNVSQPKLMEFRQEWLSMVAGVYNSHKTPMLEADKFEWQDLHKSNVDMEFSKWNEYLIKIACAIYKIDPSEIGFPSSGSSGDAPLFESSNASKLEYSKDNGLKPILKFIQSKINKYLIWRIDPNYEFSFVGLDNESESQEDARIIAATASYMEINEARRIKGLPEKPGYDMIANPVVQQAKNMTMMGNSDSNQVVDDMDQEEEDQKKIKKSIQSNPMMKDFEDFMKKEFS